MVWHSKPLGCWAPSWADADAASVIHPGGCWMSIQQDAVCSVVSCLNKQHFQVCRPSISAIDYFKDTQKICYNFSWFVKKNYFCRLACMSFFQSGSKGKMSKREWKTGEGKLSKSNMNGRHHKQSWQNDFCHAKEKNHIATDFAFVSKMIRTWLFVAAAAVRMAYFPHTHTHVGVCPRRSERRELAPH